MPSPAEYEILMLCRSSMCIPYYRHALTPPSTERTESNGASLRSAEFACLAEFWESRLSLCCRWRSVNAVLDVAASCKIIMWLRVSHAYNKRGLLQIVIEFKANRHSVPMVFQVQLLDFLGPTSLACR
jgi:hypothetical protein